jgi:hypothetical protein
MRLYGRRRGKAKERQQKVEGGKFKKVYVKEGGIVGGGQGG